MSIAAVVFVRFVGLVVKPGLMQNGRVIMP